MSWATAMMARARKRLGSRSGPGPLGWSGRSRVEARSRVEVMVFLSERCKRKTRIRSPGLASVALTFGEGLVSAGRLRYNRKRSSGSGYTIRN